MKCQRCVEEEEGIIKNMIILISDLIMSALAVEEEEGIIKNMIILISDLIMSVLAVIL